MWERHYCFLCTHTHTHIQTYTHSQDDFSDYAQQCGAQTKNSITMHPLITCCSQGCSLSLSLTGSSGRGVGLWPLSQLSLGSLFQLLQLHTVPNHNPTSRTTACVLTSLSRRPRTSSSDQNPAETSPTDTLTSLCGSCSSQALWVLWVLELDIFMTCYATRMFGGTHRKKQDLSKGLFTLNNTANISEWNILQSDVWT